MYGIHYDSVTSITSVSRGSSETQNVLLRFLFSPVTPRDECALVCIIGNRDNPTRRFLSNE